MADRIRNIRIIADLQIIESEPAAWSPADLSNLKLWTKSDTGVTQIGNAVSSWADQSGNGNDLLQASDPSKPTLTAGQLNGYPAIVFDGSDDFLKAAAFTLNQPWTVFMVFKQNSWTSGDSIIDGQTENSGRIFQNGASPQITQYSDGFGVDTSDLAVDTYGLLTSVFNGTSNKLQVNGNAPTTGGATTGNPGGLTLGCFGNTGAGWSHISVVEIIIMSSVADATDIQNVRDYVTSRYGTM